MIIPIIRLPLLCLLLSFSIHSLAQSATEKIYEMDVNVPTVAFRSDHLKLGGVNAQGQTMAVNNHYLSLQGKPFIAVTGEFHFTRYPRKYWEESIRKMKAGGINMIACYVFWSMHEEQEGQFTWQGTRDLRAFVELCGKHQLQVIVRIGPFGHGEIRNGGLPDWLLGKPFSVRSNDPGYLFYVERLYQQIGQQLKGLYFKDGGPIVATQLENEYQHSASPWGLTYPGQPYDWTAAERDLAVTQQGVGISEKENPYANLGNEHLQVLKSLALKAGIDTPFYTATGWGNAAILPNESLPVTSAYAYPTWTDKKDLSPFYLYTDLHQHPDYAPVRYQPEDYPVLAAELGSGIMSTYTRRPVVPAQSMDALINRCLGSGANGIGYYMYHGGSTPKGAFFFNDEAYGYPKISYDFQAPIGEYGQIRPGFHRLKLLHYFTAAFGDLLAPTATVLPATNAAIRPDNLTDLRYAVRVKDNAGFVFLNNFQDDTLSPDQVNVQLRLKTGKEEIRIPETGGLTLKGQENAVFPFNFNLEGARLRYATAQLLTKGPSSTGAYYVFFAPEGVAPQFSFADAAGQKIQAGPNCWVTRQGKHWLVRCPEKAVSEFGVRTAHGASVRVLVVDKAMALKAWPVTLSGQPHLLFSEASALPDGASVELFSLGKHNFEVLLYPKTNLTPRLQGGKLTVGQKHSLLSSFVLSLPQTGVGLKATAVDDKRLSVDLSAGKPAALNDVFLSIDYRGDTGMGFLNGELVADEFYKGIPWEVGLKRFLDQPEAKTLHFYFRPMYKGASFLVDLPPASLPDFGQSETVSRIQATTFVPEYKAIIRFE